MANSVSSPSSYLNQPSSSSTSNKLQLSPNSHHDKFDGYRHHPNNVFNSNIHRAHRTTDMQASMNRFRLSSLKGKSWSSFEAESSEDESDSDHTPEDPLAASPNRHNRGSIVRLKKRDIPLYGYCPETEPFTIVTCRQCRMVLKAAALKRHIDLRHEPMVKIEKIPEKYANVEKLSGGVEKISVVTPEVKRHRKSTPEEISIIETAPPPLPAPPPTVTVVIPLSESSSASNSPQQPSRKKRKQQLETVIAAEQPTFQSLASTTPPQPPVTSQSCRIIMSSSSPPPLAPITQEAPPSVWIVTPSPAVIIDGSFVVKPLEAEIEIDTEIDLKDLKVLKPALKEPPIETQTQLTASNWYATHPRPLALNTFNMRKINAQRYVMATQRKLIELGRTLRQDDKIGTAVIKPQPKTWSFIERNQVFIPFRVTH